MTDAGFFRVSCIFLNVTAIEVYIDLICIDVSEIRGILNLFLGYLCGAR